MSRNSPARSKSRERLREVKNRTRSLARRVDSHPLLIGLTARVRSWLPGDSRYGDPLSVGTRHPADWISRRLTSVPTKDPSVLREIGLSALQVWQAHAGSSPDEVGSQELAVLFTDLAGFSDWVLAVGDDTAVEYLRRVGAATEPLIRRRHGRVVKRLGDGLMAVFPDADAALSAAIDARDAVHDLDVDGHRLELRAGVHLGRPRKLGDDYYGVDVNIAARVTAAAGAGQVVVSSTVRDRLDDPELRLRRRLRFAAKGVPDGIHVYSVST